MTTDIIEGTARDVTPDNYTSVVVAQPQSAVQTFDAPSRDPLRALGRMTEADYVAEVKSIVDGTNRMMALQRDLLRDGTDYGTIPGTQKPTLLQPGAERLAMFHRLIPEQHVTKTITQVSGHPDRIEVEARCLLHLGSLEGPVLGSAQAACSSYEDRYRWRIRQRTCPACQAEAIIKGKAEWGGGWVCLAKRGGCGEKFKGGYQPIESQTIGRVENEEPYSLLNTIVQMAQKRAFVAAIRHTLGITDLFTEEIEEGAGLVEGPAAPETAAAAPAATTSRPSTPPKASSAPVASTPAPTQAATPPGTVTFEGPVVATPDGIRQTASGRVLAFAIKVGNSKHNVDLWDDLAAAAQPHIVEGTRIRVDGRRVEEDWPGRGDKPMKKVIKDVTIVAVVDEKGTRVVAQAAPKAPQPVQQALPGPDDGPPLFDDEELPFTPGELEAVYKAAEPVKATGDPQGTADITGTIRIIEWRRTPQGADYVALEVVDGGLWYDVAVGKDDALMTVAAEVGGPFSVKADEKVRVMGGWSRSGAIIIAGIVAPA